MNPPRGGKNGSDGAPAAPGRGSGSNVFVLDTNVILHDGACLDRFEDNDVVVPMAVLEELDRFKRGGQAINLQARQFLRSLDEVSGDVFLDRGASLGAGRGRVRVVLSGKGDSRLESVFCEDSPDHRIVQCALQLRDQEQKRTVVLVTKDVNLRIKARSLQLVAQDYVADKESSVDRLYSGRRIVEGVPGRSLDAFFDGNGSVDPRSIPQVTEPRPNENFVLRNGTQSVLATYRHPDRLCMVRPTTAYGVRPRNAEQCFALHALLDDDLPLVTLTGRAGTGKTLLALAAALECRKRYRQILLARPLVPLGNRELGFLPGDVGEKIHPYMQPLFDNLGVIREELGGDREKAAQNIALMREQEKLLITPLAFIRGRSIQRCYFIVDEAQNLTPHEVKTIITRAGEGTKVVLTGDIRQIDQPYLDASSNGLTHLIDRMVGQQLFAHVTLEKGERSELSDLASRLL